MLDSVGFCTESARINCKIDRKKEEKEEKNQQISTSKMNDNIFSFGQI